MKIGLIGCGKQAWKHIAGLGNEEDVEIAVCDINTDRARAIGEKFDLPWSDDVDAFLADDTLTAVNIATPTLTHADLVMRAVEAGKHFFCEKPLCRHIDDSRRIRDGVVEKSLIGMVGYVYRYSPVFEVGHALSGLDVPNARPLGAPVAASFRIGGRGDHEVWKHRQESSGGAISEMMVHMLDLAIWYFGPVRSVQVVSCELLRPLRHIAGVDVRVDAEDFVLARFEMAGGLQVLIQADLVTPAFSQFVEVQFERGSFMGSIQNDYPSYVFSTEAADMYPEGKTPLRFGTINLFERQMAAFCEHVRNDKPLERNTIDDSLRVMEALEMLRQR